PRPDYQRFGGNSRPNSEARPANSGAPNRQANSHQAQRGEPKPADKGAKKDDGRGGPPHV
ncbi:MAG: hypothetical protein ACRD1L_13115, partial [Terriglobales bacterium]